MGIFLLLGILGLNANIANANGKPICSQEQVQRGCKEVPYNCHFESCPPASNPPYDPPCFPSQTCEYLCQCGGDQSLDNITLENLMQKFRQSK